MLLLADTVAPLKGGSKVSQKPSPVVPPPAPLSSHTNPVMVKTWPVWTSPKKLPLDVEPGLRASKNI